MNDSDKVFETEFGRVSIESDPDSWAFLMYKRLDPEERGDEGKRDEALEKVVEDLGFCQCGDTEKALRFILDGLRCIHFQQAIWELPYPDTVQASHDERDRRHLELDERRLKVFGSLGATYFFCYWLDKENYTEHGTTIMGSWLTESGRLLALKIIDVLGGEMKDE